MEAVFAVRLGQFSAVKGNGKFPVIHVYNAVHAFVETVRVGGIAVIYARNIGKHLRGERVIIQNLPA